MRIILVIVMCSIMAGCKTLPPSAKSENESTKDVASALKSVAGAVKGSPMTEGDIKNLNKQIRDNKEAQSAVSSITQSMGGQSHTVKYCPKDGKRFAGSVKMCPEHNVELRWVDE